jgi:hypothetical protein
MCQGRSGLPKVSHAVVSGIGDTGLADGVGMRVISAGVIGRAYEHPWLLQHHFKSSSSSASIRFSTEQQAT